MSFAFADGFHAGLDCAGEAAPEVGIVTGWVRHGSDDLLDVTMEEAPGAPLPVPMLSFHPRPDVPAGAGLTVTGFSLAHGASRNGGRGIVVVRAGDQEARVDLATHDVPSDVPAALAAGAGQVAFDILAAAAAAPDRVPLLGGGHRGLGAFARYLSRQARVTGATDWFQDFRRVAAHRLPLGEVVLAGSFAAPGAGLGAGPGTEEAEVSALALVTPGGPAPDGFGDAPEVTNRVVPLRASQTLGLPDGFVLHGFVDGVAEDETVELVVSIRRGAGSWTFRAEAVPGPLEPFLDAFCLVGFDLPDLRAASLDRWLRRALDGRLDALREPMARLSVLRGTSPAGAAPVGRGTALLFDLDEPLAARVLALVAPMLEKRFERIIVTGSAAARAVAALSGRPGLEVSAEADAANALATAAASGGAVVPADTAALASLAIRGDLGSLAGPGLEPARLEELLVLHGLAGMGGIGGTLRRVTAIMEGDAGATAVPVVRTDAGGGLVAAHLGAVWRAASFAGAGARAAPPGETSPVAEQAP